MSYSGAAFDRQSLMPMRATFDTGTGMFGASIAGGAWPSANLAIYVPHRVNSPTWLRRFWYVSANNTGNIDIGIYSAALLKITSTGATAQSTINQVNFIDVTDVLLQPGDYWLALSCASATAQPFRNNASGGSRCQGVSEEASAHPLPGTATPVAPNQEYIPFFGYSTIAAEM